MEGRQHINFSDWDRPEPQHVDEFQKVYDENRMPPWYYSLLDPATQLGYGEKQQLFAGLAVLARKSGQ